MFVHLASERNSTLKHEGHEFKGNLGYIVRACLQRHTWADRMAQWAKVPGTKPEDLSAIVHGGETNFL